MILDTNHVSRLRDLDRGKEPPRNESTDRLQAYRSIRKRLESGEITPVVGRDQAFDWVRHRTQADALETGDVLDRSASVLLGANSIYVFLVELLDAAKLADPSIKYERQPFLQSPGTPDWSTRFMAKHYPGMMSNFSDDRVLTMPRITPSVRALANDAHRVAGLEVRLNQDVIATFKSDVHAMNEQGPGRTRGFSRASRMDFICRRLHFSEVLESCSPSLPTPVILSRLQLDTCRGLDLWFQVLWIYFSRHPQPRDTDHGDLSYIHLLPYVHYGLLERGMCGIVRGVASTWKQRVFPSAETLVARLNDVCGDT